MAHDFSASCANPLEMAMPGLWILQKQWRIRQRFRSSQDRPEQSVSAPLVIVIGRRIVAHGERQTTVWIARAVPVNLDVTDMAIHKTDHVSRIVVSQCFS